MIETYELFEHDWEENETAATCTESAYKVSICKICAAKEKTQTAPALGHLSDGSRVCARCKQTLPVIIGEIKENTATGCGGGIYQTSGNLNVKGGVITGNEAKGNGGGVCVNPAKYNQTNVTVSGGDISNNTADENGGGIWMTKHSKNRKRTNLKISGGIIHDNNAKNGGGVYVNSGVVFSLYRTYITGNTANRAGKVIYLSVGCLMERIIILTNR